MPVQKVVQQRVRQPGRRAAAPQTEDGKLIAEVCKVLGGAMGSIRAATLAQRMGIDAAMLSRANAGKSLPNGRVGELQRMLEVAERKGEPILTDVECAGLRAMARDEAASTLSPASIMALCMEGLVDRTGTLTRTGRSWVEAHPE